MLKTFLDYESGQSAVGTRYRVPVPASLLLSERIPRHEKRDAVPVRHLDGTHTVPYG